MNRITVAAAIVVFGALSAQATDYTFNVSNGVWDNANNWDPIGTPIYTDSATIPNESTCRVEDANQAINELTIASGGTLQIKGKDLTIYTGATVNGDLEFHKPGEDDPRLLIDGYPTIDGNGTISASVADELGPGIIEGWGSITFDRRLTLKGSVKIHVNVRNKGVLLVDHDEDVMEIGYMSETVCDILGNDDGGTFRVTDGTMKFGNVRPQYLGPKPHSKWKVEGGTMELTTYALSWWTSAEHPVEVSGGTLELNALLATSGRFSFTGGEIEVAAGNAAVFYTP